MNTKSLILAVVVSVSCVACGGGMSEESYQKDSTVQVPVISAATVTSSAVPVQTVPASAIVPACTASNTECLISPMHRQ